MFCGRIGKVFVRRSLSINLTFVLALTSLFAISDDFSKYYEKPDCRSGDIPEGDVTLNCTQSDTVENLRVTILDVKLVEDTYSAVARITNTNPYAVEVKTVLVDALNDAGQVIGFCLNTFSQILYPQEYFRTNIDCGFSRVGPGSISTIKVRATPWE